MNLQSSLQEDHGRGLRRKRAFNLSPTMSPLSTLSLLSTSPTSPVTSDGEATSTNISFISSQSIGDFHHKNQMFSCKAEMDPNQRHSPDWTNESPTHPFVASLSSPVLNSRSENYLSSDPVLSADAVSSDSTQFGSPENPDQTENLPMQIKSGLLVCCWKTCGKTFSNLKELAVHVSDDHVSIKCPDMDFQCRWQGCSRQGRGFNARYKMLIHIRTHTNEKPHTCVVCNKTFSRLENFKIHTRSHTGEKPYMCSFPGCGKAYSNSSDRFKHVRTHQEEKPYKCKMPGCRKQYTDPSSLRKHVRTHGHFGSTEVRLHRLFSIEVPKDEDGLKFKEDYGDKRHCVDAQTNFNHVYFCELNNQSSSDHLRKQKRINGHYLDVQCDSSISVGENRVFRKSLTECDTSLKTFCKMELSEDKVNSLDQFRVDDNKFSNSGRFRFSGDSLNNSKRLRLAEDKLHISDEFKCAEDRLSNLNRFTDAVEAQKLSWRKPNIISEVLNNETQELCSVTVDKGKSSHVQNVQKSEKCNSLFDYCNEQSESKTRREQKNKQDNLFANGSKVWKHSGTSISDLSHKLESSYPVSTHNCSENVSFHLSNGVGSECDKKAKHPSSSPILNLSNQSSKTSHIEHWKKRKIMNREKELQTLLHSSSSLTQSDQSLKSYSPPSLTQPAHSLKSYSPPSLPQPAHSLKSYSPPSLTQPAQSLKSYSPPSLPQPAQSLKSYSPPSLPQPAQSLKSYSPPSLTQPAQSLKSYSPPSVTQPAQALKSYSPPSVTQPAQSLKSYSPPFVTQPSQSLKSYSPPFVTQPSQSLKSYSPPSVTQPSQSLKSYSPPSVTQPAQALNSYSPPSVNQPAKALRSHSTPASQNSQPCFENPATSSVSLLSNIPPTNSTPFTDTPFLPTHASPTPHPSTVATATISTLVPPLPQHIQQPLPSVHPSPSVHAVDPTLYITHPSALYPLLSPPDPRIYPSLYMPSLSSLTLSACSVIPLPTAYHLNSNPDLHSDFYPVHILPPETSFHHFKLQLPGAKEMWEHISPTYLQHVQDLEDASVLSAASLGHIGFSYPDFLFHHSTFHQSCRNLFPLHLEAQR